MNALDAREPQGLYEVSVAEYEASRARYIRTVTKDAEKRYAESIGRRREPLREEIANLTELAQYRYETYQEALRAYAAKAPGRVNGESMMPPHATAEKMVAGITKLYKAAKHAAEEFRECNEILKKRKTKLAEIDWKLRVKVEEHGRDLIAQLETEMGLAGAFRRDPLLGRAHARMLEARARQNAILSAR